MSSAPVVFDPYDDFDWDAHHRIAEEALKVELARRIDIQSRIKTLQGKAIALEVAKRDFNAFCDDWCWTYDPRNVSKGLPTTIPFKLRPKQREFGPWLEDRLKRRENGLVEKSRDEGLTWLIGAFFLHKWLFEVGFKAGLGSRKLELVDRSDDMDAIFPKIRFLLEHLPDWMKPEGFRERAHNKYCRLVNPVNGSSITGEGGDSIGRGGRNTMYFVDEHSKLDNAQMVEAALSQNSDCIIYGGTPFGVGNLFYQKRHDGRTPVFTFHWMDNPTKNFYVEGSDGARVFPWYEMQKLKYDAVTIAAEIDIDYSASVRGTLIPAKYIQAAIRIRLEPGGRRAVGLDVSDSLSGEGDATIWGFREGGCVMGIQIIDEADLNQKAARVVALTKDANASHLYYDRVGVGAGLRGTLENDPELPFAAFGIVANGSPSSRIYEDDPKYRAKYRFRNKGSEFWWALMLRFKRTYERFHGVKTHPDDDCISLSRLSGHPEFGTIVNQLSQPTVQKDSSDKIRVDKMGAGSKSPDYAEMIMLAFAPGDAPTLIDVRKPDWM